jgi:hypothetical protein
MKNEVHDFRANINNIAFKSDWTLDKNSLYPPENPSEFGFCHNHAYTSGTMCFL